MPEYLPPPSSLKPGAIVWAYLRDSGGVNQDQSVPQQLDQIKAYCEKHSLILEQVFSDVAKSGTRVNGRDAFHNMVALGGKQKGRPAAVLVWNFARFARNLDDAMYYKAALRRRGIIIHSLNEPLPEGDQSRFLEMAYDYSSQLESERKSIDSKRGLAVIVKQGFAAGGTPPRGYIAVPVEFGKERYGQKPRYVSKWVPDPEKADLLRLAFRLRSQGKSYQEITKATRGLYTCKASWLDCFANKTYIGIGKCGELEVPDHHEPLVDQETWDKVQRVQLEAKYKRGNVLLPQRPRQLTSTTILTGMLYCIECGSAMHKDRVGKRDWDCYVCGKKRREAWKSCPSRQVSSKLADQKIFDAVMNRIMTADMLHNLVNEMRNLYSDKIGLQAQIARLKRELVKNEKIINNLLDEIEQSRSSITTERLKTRESERALLLFELQAVEHKLKLSNFEITSEALELIVSTWRTKILEEYKAGNIREAKLFMKDFVKKIELGYNRAVIWYTFPIDALQSELERGETGVRWGHLSYT